MALKRDYLRELLDLHPEGWEAMLRYGLHQALGIDPHGAVDEYMPRVGLLRHDNNFLEVRLDYQSEQARGQILFAVDVARPGDYRSQGAAKLPVYFDSEAETRSWFNSRQCWLARQSSGAGQPIEPTTHRA